MKIITTVKHKGKVVLSKKLSKKPKKSILDLAGFIKIPKGRSVLTAREKFENNYSRI